VAAGAFDRQIDAICHAGSAAGSIGPVGRAGATPSRAAGSAWHRFTKYTMPYAGHAGHACDGPRYEQKDHNLDCHPGASTGILASTLALPAVPVAARHSRSCGGLHANFYAVNCKMG